MVFQRISNCFRVVQNLITNSSLGGPEEEVSGNTESEDNMEPNETSENNQRQAPVTRSSTGMEKGSNDTEQLILSAESARVEEEVESNGPGENAVIAETDDANNAELDSSSFVPVEITEYEYDNMNMSGATTLDSEYEEYEDENVGQGVDAVTGEKSLNLRGLKERSRMLEVDEEEHQSAENLPEGDLVDGNGNGMTKEIVAREGEGEQVILVAYDEEDDEHAEENARRDVATDPDRQSEDSAVTSIQSGVTNMEFSSAPIEISEYYEATDDGSQIQLVEELVADGDDDTMDQDLNDNVEADAESAELDVLGNNVVINEDLDVLEDGDGEVSQQSSHKRPTDSSSKKRFMMGVGEDAELLVDDKISGPIDIDLEDIENNASKPFLEINTRRRLSQEGREGNCYCGKDRNLNIAELLCASCNRWYHESCIGYQLGKLVPFMMNYVFICKNCSPNGLESFKRNQAQFTQMCITALANLTQMDIKEGRSRKRFSCEKDIIPFFDMHWDGMTTMTRRATQSWHTTVTKALLKDQGKHFFIEDPPDDPNAPYFGLKSLDTTQIRPNYEAMIRSGHLKLAESQSSAAAARGRGSKRRVGGADIVGISQASLAKRAKGDNFLPKLASGHGYPSDHPFNKDGFRYVLAEPDSNAPFRQEFDESSDWSKIIPGWLYRVLNPWNVFLALHDRAPQLKVSEDRHSVTGDKGYCMIRATHGVSYGSWYWEAKVVEMPEGSATRIGWGQQYSNLQGPLGIDQFGYSYRSRFGTKFCEAKGKHYGEPYTLGDVLGCLIILPQKSANGRYSKVQPLPPSHKEKPLVRFKSHLYYEEKDGNHETELKSIHEGSEIIFFKNGICQGVAYQNIFDGIYYPAISLYKGITVAVNYGPSFEHFPEKYPCKGMNERAEEATIEQTLSDLVFLTENEGKLRLDTVL